MLKYMPQTYKLKHLYFSYDKNNDKVHLFHDYLSLIIRNNLLLIFYLNYQNFSFIMPHIPVPNL